MATGYKKVLKNIFLFPSPGKFLKTKLGLESFIIWRQKVLKVFDSQLFKIIVTAMRTFFSHNARNVLCDVVKHRKNGSGRSTQKFLKSSCFLPGTVTTMYIPTIMIQALHYTGTTTCTALLTSEQQGNYVNHLTIPAQLCWPMQLQFTEKHKLNWKYGSRAQHEAAWCRKSDWGTVKGLKFCSEQSHVART